MNYLNLKQFKLKKINFAVVACAVMTAAIFNSCSPSSQPNGSMVLKINGKVGAMAVTCLGINVMGEGLPRWDELKDQVKISPNAGGGVNQTATWNGVSRAELNFADLAAGDKIVQVYTNNLTTDCAMDATTGKLVELGRGNVTIIGGKDNIAEITITSADPSTITTDIRDWSGTITAPAAPSSFLATATSDTAISLTWVDNSTDELSFRIESSPDNSTWTLLTTTAANAVVYNHTGLTPVTQYYYRILARNGAGDSAFVTADATTQTPPPPAAPSGLAATPKSASNIELTWTDNSTNEAYFEIFRSLDNITFNAIASSTTNVAFYSNTGLSASTLYYYKVRSVNAGGNSADTATVSASTTNGDPIAPSILVGIPNLTSADLNWQDNSGEEDGFEIERSLTGGGAGFTLLNTVSANVNVYQDFSVMSGNDYYYRVRATRAGFTSSVYSNEFLVSIP